MNDSVLLDNIKIEAVSGVGEFEAECGVAVFGLSGGILIRGEVGQTVSVCTTRTLLLYSRQQNT